MDRVGIIAGAGSLPLEFVRSVKKNGEEPVVFAIKGIASDALEKEGCKVFRLELNQYGKFALLLFSERVKRIALLGTIKKETVYSNIDDSYREDFFKKVKDKKDYTLLKSFTDKLKMIGVDVIDSSKYLRHLVPSKGLLTSKSPDKDLEETIKFGFDMAKKVAGLDIGQTVIVKDKSVVCVEAMEGTDATIERARQISGPGCVMVKVSRPDQDMRWDIPTVGARTMEKLAQNDYRALAIEGGSMYLIERKELIDIADSRGIVVEVL